MKKLIIIIIVISLFSCWYLFSREELLLVSNQFYFQTEERLEGKVELELLTYNIQRGIGLDGRLDLERTASVIRGSGADIIGLNEVDVRTGRSGFRNQAGYLAEALEMNYAFGPSIRGYIGSYGNAILSRYPIIDVENIFLPVLEGSEGENRSLLKARLDLGGGRIINILLTHLSLNLEERREQIKWINQYLEKLEDPYILMGDFNTEAREVLYYIREEKGGLVSLVDNSKTYPADLPVKGIDLFFSDGRVTVLEEYTIDSPASDHLPLYLKISLSAG
ncbi:MAG: endonuclease [Halanaerobiaceae bacterium]|nr:endonuclease [Halanaerobiaceae bacterium]